MAWLDSPARKGLCSPITISSCSVKKLEKIQRGYFTSSLVPNLNKVLNKSNNLVFLYFIGHQMWLNFKISTFLTRIDKSFDRLWTVVVYCVYKFDKCPWKFVKYFKFHIFRLNLRLNIIVREARTHWRPKNLRKKILKLFNRIVCLRDFKLETF